MLLDSADVTLLKNPIDVMRRLLISALLILIYCNSQARSTDEILQSVQAAIKAEDYPKAEQHLTELVSQDPKVLESWVSRATVRILMGDAKGSESDFAAATALDALRASKARHFICHRAVWRARDLVMKDKKQEALRIYDAVLALNPKPGMAYHERGGLKIDLQDFDGAIADLTQAIQHDQGNNTGGDSHLLRSKARRAKGDMAGAMADEASAKNKTTRDK